MGDVLRLSPSAGGSHLPVVTPSLKFGGGNGTPGSMELRLAKVEVDVDYIKRDVGELKIDVRSMKSDISDLRVDVARLDERVKALPGKGFLVTTSLAIITFLSAMFLFADKLREVLGVAH